jgi:hypothetical protein
MRKHVPDVAEWLFDLHHTAFITLDTMVTAGICVGRSGLRWRISIPCFRYFLQVTLYPVF